MKRVAIVVSILAILAVIAFMLVNNTKVIQALIATRPPTVTPTVGTQTPQATIPPVKAGDDIVVEGRLVPVRYVNLSFNTTGLVSKVLVSEGETVKGGQLLAQLSNQEQTLAAIASAQLELINAQQALKAIYDNAPLAAAQALQALVNAPTAVEEAQRTLNSLKGGSVNQADIDIAKANLVFAEKKLRDAEAAYKPYANKPENNLIRAALLSKLSQAQKEYDAALRKYNALIGAPTPDKIKQAEADLALAKAQLAEAQRVYEILKNGPNPDDVALAQARIKNAEAQLEAAQAALANLEIRAPFTGTVVTLNLQPGEYVAPGAPVILLVDFSAWRVETTDLTELNVVRINQDSPVSITFDALPELTFKGKVLRINPIGENKQGDITYTALIDIFELDERLRWNMTCSVVIHANGEK